MSKIDTDPSFINIEKFIEYDGNGDPYVKYKLTPGYNFVTMADKVDTLERIVQQLLETAIQEEGYRALHPSVQDAWEKYQEVLKLVKE